MHAWLGLFVNQRPAAFAAGLIRCLWRRKDAWEMVFGGRIVKGICIF